MDQLSYVVDSSLGAVPLNKMNFMRAQVRKGKPIGSSNSIASDRPVLTGTQQLQPNVLYESSNNPNVRYYLPLYRISSSNGKPEVELRYSGGEEDGDVGRLTLTLTWDPPAAPPGIQLRAIDHLANLELRSLIPVEDNPNAARTDAIPLQPLRQEVGNNLAGIRAKSVTIFPEKSQFDAVYQAMRDVKRAAVLHITITARVAVKTWQQVMVGGMANNEQQAHALERRGALVTRTLNKATLATLKVPTGAKSQAPVQLKSAKPDEQIRVQAVQAMMVRPGKAMQPGKPAAVQPKKIETLGAQGTPSAMSPAPQKMMVSPATMRMAAPAMREGRMVAGVTAVHSGTIKRASVVAPIPSSETLSMVNEPQLATAVSVSDLKINNRKAIPIQIALGFRGEPALVDTELESQQDCQFSFDPAASQIQGVFATQGFDSGGIHVLLRLVLSDENGRPFIVYQDNLMREVVHIAPDEFRLVRDRQPPFLPDLTLLPADFTTSEREGEAEVLFKVAMNYRLEPWMSPKKIELARKELLRQKLDARFTPILPREAKLTLEGDLLKEVSKRDMASVEPTTGITDTLVLDSSVFTNIWRTHLAQPGVGIRGQVSYHLFDGSTAASDVSISFWETSSDVFDIDPLGPVEGKPGVYRVRVRNRIESPVTIEELPVEAALADGVVAKIINASSLINKKLEPQEVVDIEYQVTPAEANVGTILPEIYGSVEPNLRELLKVLMLNRGYSSMGFTVPVKAMDGVFTAPRGAGEEPLTGLVVEFDDGAKVKLTPTAPEMKASLVGQLTAQLLGEQDDQHRYFYRVTNLHPSGEGARTGWKEGQGEGLLSVGTVVASLDI